MTGKEWSRLMVSATLGTVTSLLSVVTSDAQELYVQFYQANTAFLEVTLDAGSIPDNVMIECSFDVELVTQSGQRVTRRFDFHDERLKPGVYTKYFAHRIENVGEIRGATFSWRYGAVGGAADDPTERSGTASAETRDSRGPGVALSPRPAAGTDLVPPGRRVQIVSGVGKCLDVHAPDQYINGARVQVWDCNRTLQQTWYQRGNTIRSGAGKCLDVHAPDQRANGARVQVWDCNRALQQTWVYRDGEIRSGAGKCLDVHAPDQRQNGARVQVWGCNGAIQQRWVLRDLE